MLDRNNPVEFSLGSLCKGPRDTTPKGKKIDGPVCGELVHPSSMIRHLKRKHEEGDVEKQRKRTATGKTPQIRRDNRKRFRAAHPEVVSNLISPGYLL